MRCCRALGASWFVEMVIEVAVAAGVDRAVEEGRQPEV